MLHIWPSVGCQVVYLGQGLTTTFLRISERSSTLLLFIALRWGAELLNTTTLVIGHNHKRFKLFEYRHLLFLLLCLSAISGCNKDAPEYIQRQKDLMAKKAEAISIEAQNFFEMCSSMDELKEHLGEIKKIDGVQDAYISGGALYVDVKGWGKVAYIYQPEYDFEVDYDFQDKLSELLSTIQTKGSSSKNNHYSVCIGNQIFNNENLGYIYDSNTAFALVSFLRLNGIECSVVQPTLEWISSGMYDYDSAILLTHGFYDYGLHWILTSEELGLEKWIDNYSEIENKLAEKGNAFLMPACVKETRGGKDYKAWYIAVSDLYIKSTNSRGFSEGIPHIVFSVACHSLEGNDSMANAFINKGADYYLGYDNKNSIGPKAFSDFFVKLVEGKSVAEAFNTMGYKRDLRYHGELHCVPNPNDFEDAWSTYIVPPNIPSKFVASLGNGIIINRGYYPPKIEGEYIVSPLIYQYGTWPYYYSGMELPYTVHISFSGQDNDNMTINVEIANSNGLEKTSGIGHLGGFGKQFSVYLNGEGQGTGYAYNENYELYPFSQAYTADILLSGTVNGTYIEGLQYGFTVTGKSEEPTNAIIHVADVGTTMVFRDGDGITVFFPFPATAYYPLSTKSISINPFNTGPAFVLSQ